MKKGFYFAIVIMALLFPSCEESDLQKSKKVTTGIVSEITFSTAILQGSVNLDVSLYEKVTFGVMIAKTKEELETHQGEIFQADVLTGKDFKLKVEYLAHATQYFYCAWVLLNETQYEFGKIKDFTTMDLDNTFSFSVSNSKQVAFSPENLYYHNGNWSFKTSKNEYFSWSGSSSRYDDKFGINVWHGDYSGDFVDWGTNIIEKYAPNTWRTLMMDEWEFLLNTRENAANLAGIAQVNGINGLIILPDMWICPDGIKLELGFYDCRPGEGVESEQYGKHQSLTNEQWLKLEQSGAIFLPSFGNYYVIDHNRRGDTDIYGYYWSGTAYDEDDAYCFVFTSESTYVTHRSRNLGMSVRLVRDL
jgi:hypothetical protein